MSEEGVRIDPARVTAIQNLPPLTSKKATHSFMGKINFVRRFVPEFAQIVKPINSLLRKEMEFDWDNNRQSSFTAIKDVIASAPVLDKPDFNRDFLLYTNVTEEAISAILIQTNLEGYEQPIAFMSQSLIDAEFKFPYVKKHALALVVALRKFRHYIHGCHTIVNLPIPVVKHLLSQTYLQGKLANWLANIQEYDLEFTITKAIKGRDLALHLAQHPGPECSDIDEDIKALFYVFAIEQSETSDDNIEPPWYDEIADYLETQTFPVGTKPNERRRLRLESSKYVLVNNTLFRRHTNGMILCCLTKDQVPQVLSHFHDVMHALFHSGGNFAATATAHKILRYGYYWPTIFKDSFEHVRQCQPCQYAAGRQKLAPLPLHTVVERVISQTSSASFSQF